MDAEVTNLAGPKGRHDPSRTAIRHGADDGTVTLGGRRLPIRRPRVRSVGDDGRETPLESYPLESYGTFASVDLLAGRIVAGMLAGLSTRRYEAGLEPVGAQITDQATGCPSRPSPAGSWPPPRRGWPSCWLARSMIAAG